jgi:hypothetical protein
MRFLILLIVVLLFAYKFWPEQPAPTAQESFIGPQLEPLNEANQIEQQYLDALQKTNERIERESDGG